MIVTPDGAAPRTFECSDLMFSNLYVQIGLYAQLHNFSVSDASKATPYGTPRDFKALIANIATSNSTALQKMNGLLTFQDGNGNQLCNATLVNNSTLSGRQVGSPHTCFQKDNLASCKAHSLCRGFKEAGQHCTAQPQFRAGEAHSDACSAIWM